MPNTADISVSSGDTQCSWTKAKAVQINTETTRWFGLQHDPIWPPVIGYRGTPIYGKPHWGPV